MVYHAEELLGIAFIRNSIIGSAEKKGQWDCFYIYDEWSRYQFAACALRSLDF